ncbi:MAG: hypothetical protein ACRERC_10070 [Candidatus Binatia bacterium]
MSASAATLARRLLPLAVALLAALPAAALPTAQVVLTAMGFSADEQQQVMNGDLVSSSATSSTERELAIHMALLINRPADQLAQVFRDAGDYKQSANVIAFGALAAPATLGDFAALTLDDATAQSFLNAQPGTAVNLSPQEIAAFAALRAQAPADVDTAVAAQLRQLLLARHQTYRSGGLAAIAPYARGDGALRSPGEELADATKANVTLAQFAPHMHKVLEVYPQSRPELSDEFFWVSFANKGANPTIALTQRLFAGTGGASIFVDRHYYASSQYNTVQAISGVLPVQEGSVLIYINRTSTDQVGGFGSSVKRSVGDHMMAKEIGASLEKLRRSQ